MYKCFGCEKEVHDLDDYELFGYDGDRIHKQCIEKANHKMDYIANMSDEQFVKYINPYNGRKAVIIRR